MEDLIIGVTIAAVVALLLQGVYEIIKLNKAYRFYKAKALKYRTLYNEKQIEYVIFQTKAREEMKELKLSYNCALTELKEENKVQKRRLEDLSLKDM